MVEYKQSPKVRVNSLEIVFVSIIAIRIGRFRRGRMGRGRFVNVCGLPLPQGNNVFALILHFLLTPATS